MKVQYNLNLMFAILMTPYEIPQIGDINKNMV